MAVKRFRGQRGWPANYPALTYCWFCAFYDRFCAWVRDRAPTEMIRFSHGIEFRTVHCMGGGAFWGRNLDSGPCVFSAATAAALHYTHLMTAWRTARSLTAKLNHTPWRTGHRSDNYAPWCACIITASVLYGSGTPGTRVAKWLLRIDWRMARLLLLSGVSGQFGRFVGGILLACLF